MRRTSPLLFVLLTACGARSSLDAGDAPAASIPPASQPRACLDDLARTSPPDWERGRACDAGALGDDVGMFAMVGFDLIGITSAGPRVIHRFFEGLDAATAHAHDAAVVVRGDYVAATLTGTPSGIENGDPSSAETVLLRRDGTLVRKLVEDRAWSSIHSLYGFFLSDRGMIVAGRYFPDDIHTYAARDTGLLAKTRDVHPIAEPAPSGRFAVRSAGLNASDATLSWFDPCTGELHATRESARATRWTFKPWGHRLVYLDDVDPTQLVIEDPEGSMTIDLGEEGELIEIHPAGHALLETAVEGRVLIADLSAHTARAVTIQAPPGWSSLSVVRPTSDGRLYMAMRDSAVGFLHVSIDGASWTPVGLPIGEVAGATARETNGTFYLFGHISTAESPPWDPPPPGSMRLDLNSVQVAREDGTSVVLQNPDVGSWLDDFHLAADGGCVSNGKDGSVVITHTSSGAVMDVSLADPTFWDPVDASTFVPGDDMMSWY
jgi:hypothetical protein